MKIYSDLMKHDILNLPPAEKIRLVEMLFGVE